jgi:GNAT superfamily N-acetyltransferase
MAMSSSAGQIDGARLSAKRALIRPLLAPTDPTDAMTAYYALSHDPRRVRLTLHRHPAGRVDGFVAVCQTGRDLFVPVVVMRALENDACDLLQAALLPGRPYTIVTVPTLRAAIEKTIRTTEHQTNLVYELDADGYRPVINVMVQPGTSEFRHEIRVQDRVVAAAGVNWRTDRLADMYVYAAPEIQGRGWGRAVGSACVGSLLKSGLRPLYTVSLENAASRRLAESIGFRDSGAREFECQGKLAEP